MTAYTVGLFLNRNKSMLILDIIWKRQPANRKLMISINQGEFDQNLFLTQLYCEKQLQKGDSSVAQILRSFNPEYNDRKLFSFDSVSRLSFAKGSAEVVWSIDPLEQKNEFLYSDLFEKQMAYKKEINPLLNVTTTYNGKILVAEIDSVINDGFSEDESDGFIDYNDCPPVDTWFYMSRNSTGRVLYSWVPDRFTKLVNDAIDVNMLSIFLWLDDFMAGNRHL
ncbi:MAG: hypothetical protein JWQ57_2600 [Mucilaginibacter sp.]|nr:hypothetical protein [Mucilaginibacter sp.]